jgi:hypothetical protein
MRINDAGKWFAAPLTPGPFTEQVLILGKQNTIQRAGSDQEIRIGQPPSAILLRGENIDAS